MKGDSMLSSNISKALSEQVNAEIYSAYLYLAMSARADRMGFKGFSNWLHVQFQEEMAHALNMHDHILERGAVPSYKAVEAPETGFDSLKEMFEKVFAHEQHVSEQVGKIATLAMKENDHATYSFISWYVNEQVEEEATAEEILQKLTNIKDNTAMLYGLDTELANRVFADPFANAGII